jgi:hypothetical protein
MQISNTPIELASPPAEARSTVQSDPGTVRRRQARRAERRRARLISLRNRRSLARFLRMVAKDALDTDPIRRRNDVLLHYRAAAARTDLLQIAAMVEQADDPDPSCIAALHNLLRDGISPLYNPAVPATELRDTLDYIRRGLLRHD